MKCQLKKKEHFPHILLFEFNKEVKTSSRSGIPSDSDNDQVVLQHGNSRPYITTTIQELDWEVIHIRPIL